MSPRSTQPMAKAVQDVGNSTTLSRYAAARADKCQTMTKDAEHFMTYANMRTKR